MTRVDDGIHAALAQRGLTRRSFIKFSAAMAAALALPASFAPRIAAAVAAAPRLPVIWLRGQSCAGNSATFLRASSPTVAELLLDLLSVEYHDLLMAPAGVAAERSRSDAIARYPKGYLAVVEGGIPTGDGGVYSMVGGRPFEEIVREVAGNAIATIAVGSCAFDGGVAAAAGGATGAVGASSIIGGGTLVNLPGCPLNVDNLVATIVHYLTFASFPPADLRGRPLFAYGGLVHNQCERRAHFEFGEFVTAWGDEGSQKGWCLYKMGCKGPESYANCPTARYAEGLSWPVKAGHGCIGCTMPRFWDANSPFYQRLPDPLPFLPGLSADNIGQVLVGAVVGVTALHGTVAFTKSTVGGALGRRRARAVATAGATTPAPTAAPAPAGVPAAAAAPDAPAAAPPGQVDARSPVPVAAEAPSRADAPAPLETRAPTAAPADLPASPPSTVTAEPGSRPAGEGD